MEEEKKNETEVLQEENTTKIIDKKLKKQEEKDSKKKIKILEQDLDTFNKKLLKMDKQLKELTKTIEAKDQELEILRKEKEENNKKIKEYDSKVKLSQAELVNYRKRKDEEVTNTLKYANKDLILELLPVVDNFERAIKEEDRGNEELSKFLSGFKMIYASLQMILKNYGVEEINRVGEIFDPNLEEALLTDRVEDQEDEIILEVLQKGYKLKDRVIRPASVKINQK